MKHIRAFSLIYAYAYFYIGTDAYGCTVAWEALKWCDGTKYISKENL
jgi:hypothetical protein